MTITTSGILASAAVLTMTQRRQICSEDPACKQHTLTDPAVSRPGVYHPCSQTSAAKYSVIEVVSTALELKGRCMADAEVRACHLHSLLAKHLRYTGSHAGLGFRNMLLLPESGSNCARAREVSMCYCDPSPAMRLRYDDKTRRWDETRRLRAHAVAFDLFGYAMEK